MELTSDDAKRYSLHRRLARRWISRGGVVIAQGNARAGSRSTFALAQKVESGATLQVTFNLREVGKACKFLTEYAIYFWTCDQEGEYVLRGCPEKESTAWHVPIASSGASRKFRTIAPSCYAGRYPNLQLEVHDSDQSTPIVAGSVIMTRMLLPRGVCAAIYQPPSVSPNFCAAPVFSLAAKKRQQERQMTDDLYLFESAK